MTSRIKYSLNSISVPLLSLLTASLLSACGGSSDSSDNTDPAFDVMEVSPVDSSTNIDPNSAITATFNQSLLASSVNKEHFVLNHGNQSVEAEVQLKTDSQLILTPSSPLRKLTRYQASLNTGLSDLNGGALKEKHTWSFTTVDGVWGQEKVLGDVDSGGPNVALDQAGNAIAVWYQENGDSTYSAMASYYNATDESWQAASVISGSKTSTVAKFPRIEMDKDGNGIAVFGVVQGGHGGIWSSRFNKVNSSWSSPVEIGSATLNEALSPAITVDGLGNILAVWRQKNAGGRYSTWANRYNKANDSWGTASAIDDNSNFDVQFPAISSDGKGNAVAVWDKKAAGSITNIWAAFYSHNDHQWQAAVNIDDSANTTAVPQVAMDKNGNALVVWQQEDDDADNIWAARYLAENSGWQTPVLIEMDLGDAAVPQVAIDDQGNGIALWYQDNGVQGDGSREISKASRYDIAENSWSESGPIGDGVDAMYEQKIAFEDNGNAIAVWRQPVNFKFAVSAARYQASSNTWLEAVPVEQSAGGVRDINFALNDKGDAIVVWRQDEGDLAGVNTRTKASMLE